MSPGDRLPRSAVAGPHIDLNPDDRDAEVERLIGLGATRADVGQGEQVTFAVLADPEGNEFCVLDRHESLTD